MLVADGHVEEPTGSRDVQSLVAVAGEEVRVQRCEIQGELADAVGAIDEGEDIVCAADLREALKWHADCS